MGVSGLGLRAEARFWGSLLFGVEVDGGQGS